MKKIRLQIDAEDYAFAERMAKQDRYFGPEDCLNGILNTAITHWREHVNDMTPDHAEQKHLRAIIDHQVAEIRVLKELVSDALRANVAREQELRALHFGERSQPDWLDDELEEDPGGGMQFKDGGQSGDLDDGIPF